MKPKNESKRPEISATVHGRILELKGTESWDEYLMKLTGLVDGKDSSLMGLSIEEKEKLEMLLDSGIEFKELLSEGLKWAIKIRSNYLTKRIEFDITILDDLDLEFLDPSKSKQLPGIAEEKCRRTIKRIQEWNETQTDSSIRIAITPSGIQKIRKALSKISGKKISEIRFDKIREACDFAKTHDYNLLHELKSPRSIDWEEFSRELYADLLESL